MATWVGQGDLKKVDRTVWQYGSYVLQHHDGRLLAAFRASPEVKEWAGKYVYVKGCLVHEGLSGGPPLVDLTYIGNDPASRDASPDCPH